MFLKHFELDKKTADMINNKLQVPLLLFQWAQFALIGLGVCMLAATALLHWVRYRRENRNYVSFGAINDSSDSANLTESAGEVTPLIIH